jgi:8-oxo-dGTP diphosphatase
VTAGGVVRVGVGVIVVRDALVLVGLRRGAHGDGTWALPGGHLEFGEPLAACAARELAEETGLVATAFARGPYVETVFPEYGRHDVTLFAIAHDPLGDPVLREPAKCAGWAWHRWDALPTPRFAPLAGLLARGYIPPGA